MEDQDRAEAEEVGEVRPVWRVPVITLLSLEKTADKSGSAIDGFGSFA